MGNKGSSASKDKFAANRRERVEDILANEPRRSKRRKNIEEMTEEERHAHDLELATESHVFSGDDDQEEEEAAAAAGADTHRSNRRWDGMGGDNGPKGADKQYAEAVALRKRGDTKSCFKLLQKIIKENPKHVDSMAVYARLQWVYDDWDGAEETYLKALEIKSAHFAALEGYATFLASARGDIALAEKLFDRLQDLDTTNSTAIVRHMQAEQRLLGHKRGYDHHPESKAALAKERRSSIIEAENERARRGSQPVPGLHLNHKDKRIENLDEWRWPKGKEGALDEQEGMEKGRRGRGRRGSEQAAVEYVLKTSDVPEIHQERERRFKGFPGSDQAEEAVSPVVRSATMRGGGVARRHSALKWMMEGGLDQEYEAQRVQAHDPRELNTLRGLAGVMPASALPGRFERLIVQSFQDDWTLDSKAPETGQVWPKEWYTSNSISQAGVAGLTQREMRRASDFAAGSAPVSGMSGLKLVDNFIPMTVENQRKLRAAKKIEDQRQAVLDKDMGFNSALIAHAQEAEKDVVARGGTFDSTAKRKSGSFVRARSFRR